MTKDKNTKDKKTEETPAAEVEARPAAAPVGWDPFERLGMAEFFNRLPSWFGTAWSERPSMGVADIKVEEYMEDDELVIRGEIPGVNPAEDIEISVDNGRLAIKATREKRTETDDNGYRSEFHYGSFGRVITLPSGVDADDIKAAYTDGILEVRVPVDTDSSRSRKIEIAHS